MASPGAGGRVTGGKPVRPTRAIEQGLPDRGGGKGHIRRRLQARYQRRLAHRLPLSSPAPDGPNPSGARRARCPRAEEHGGRAFHVETRTGRNDPSGAKVARNGGRRCAGSDANVNQGGGRWGGWHAVRRANGGEIPRLARGAWARGRQAPGVLEADPEGAV